MKHKHNIGTEWEEGFVAELDKVAINTPCPYNNTPLEVEKRDKWINGSDAAFMMLQGS